MSNRLTNNHQYARTNVIIFTEARAGDLKHIDTDFKVSPKVIFEKVHWEGG